MSLMAGEYSGTLEFERTRSQIICKAKVVNWNVLEVEVDVAQVKC